MTKDEHNTQLSKRQARQERRRNQIRFARAKYAQPSDCDIEIDDGTKVIAGDDGSWVRAWVWVRDSDIEDDTDD